MKRTLIAAAASAIGAMGAAGLMSAAPAQAEVCGEAPIGLTPSNIICNINAQTGTFAMTVSPQYNLGVLVYGTDEGGERSGLGLVDQPGTFVGSVQRFLSGPMSPDPPAAAATADTPAPGTTAP
jgi:hypothetical protein